MVFRTSSFYDNVMLLNQERFCWNLFTSCGSVVVIIILNGVFLSEEEDTGWQLWHFWKRCEYKFAECGD